MKVEDFEDLDLESLTRKEKEAFVKKIRGSHSSRSC